MINNKGFIPIVFLALIAGASFLLGMAALRYDDVKHDRIYHHSGNCKPTRRNHC